MENILIVNTGGTFNKRYNPLKGELEVPNDSIAIENILQYFQNLEYTLKGVIYKDSLDMLDSDRIELEKLIKNSKQTKILVIHGTDTMDKTCEYLDGKFKDKCIVITGAMVPFSISQTEATSNLATAIGFLIDTASKGVFISMHGLVGLHNTIFKNREIGVFQKK